MGDVNYCNQSDESEEMDSCGLPISGSISLAHYAAHNPWMRGFPGDKKPSGFAAAYVVNNANPPEEYWLQLTNGLWIAKSHYRKGRYMPILAFELPSNAKAVRYKIGDFDPCNFSVF